MKNYRITVNGNAYDVSVEELNGNSAPLIQNTQKPVSVNNTAPAPVAPTPVTQAPATPPPAAPVSQGSFKINSPMPGIVLDIIVNVGDSLATNQVVIILEAMKMENEIVTPKAGKVASINVKKGDTVNSGDVLLTIE